MIESSSDRTGGCQCGALRYVVTAEPVAVAACHCADCQTQSGSAFGMSMIVPTDAFRFTRGEPATFDTQADSGTPKKCLFCAACGVRIGNQLGDRPVFNLKPGTLDDTSGFAPALHVWLDRKQAWVPIPPDAKTFDLNPG